MGGKQSKDKAGQSQALFNIRSASLDSISTSVSQRTLQSTGSALTHSPSLDVLGQHLQTNGKATTKDEKGNTYFLLETASNVTATDCEVHSVSTTDEKRDTELREQGSEDSVDKSSANRTGRRRESVGGKTSRRNESVRLTASLPVDGEKCRTAAAGTEGVSTRTATELVTRKDSRLPNTNKSKLVQRVLPTRSHSSRSAAKPATAVVAPEQREMEREVQELLKAMLKQQKQVSEPGHTQSSPARTAGDDASPTTTAQLPESLLQCSQQELNHLASYICHTIKDTLQSSLVEQALTAQQKKTTTTTAATTTTETTATIVDREETTLPSPVKRVQINEEPVNVRTGLESPRTSSSGSGAGSTGEGAWPHERRETTEERLRRRRQKRAKRERPTSSSGIYCDEDSHVHLSDPQPTSTASAAHDMHSQTHSNEESYYHRCGGGVGERSPDRRTTSCRACRERSRKYPSQSTEGGEPLHRAEQRRKRGGKSKDTPVDVSLDDNCPGVNLVRRRYSTHRHVVCDNCLQSLGRDAASGGRPVRRRQKQLQVAPDVPCTSSELQLSHADDQPEVQGVGEGSGFITLYQLRTVAQILRESSRYAGDGTRQFDRAQRKSLGPHKSNSFRQERSREQVKSKRKSVAFDDCVSVVHAEPEQDLVGPSSPERLSNLKELAYPTKTRSGRDSPATDMAVIDLRVDSPCMLQPLEVAGPPPTGPEGTTLMIQHESSPNRITHLHHHYHHIIRHGEP